MKQIDPTQEIIDEEFEDELEEENKEENLEEDVELQQELQELDSGPHPESEDAPNVLNFLNKVLESPDRFKTAYLTWEELGKPTFSTRFWLNLSNTCEDLFGMKRVAAYCNMKARITTDTSLSREGFMITTSVTQKKIKERKSSSELAKYLSGQKR